MTWIRSVPPNEAEGRLKEIYDLILKERGTIGNVYRAASLNPDALEAHLKLYVNLFYREGGLSRREREMIALTISTLNRCGYCINHHADALGRYVREPGLVPLLVADYRKAPLSPRERALLDHTVKLTRTPGEVAESDLEGLREHGLTDEEILDATQITAYVNFVSRLASGLGVPLDDVDKPYNY